MPMKQRVPPLSSNHPNRRGNTSADFLLEVITVKKCIMVSYEEEKLLALRMYAEQRGVSVEEELAQAAEAMYQKIVPANVRAFLDMKVESQKPKKKERGASASAVGDGL